MEFLESGLKSARYTLAEFFCGCGGFSRGFTRTGRFDVVLGIDIKKPALRTFRDNHGGIHGSPEVISDDIRIVSASQIRAALNKKNVTELDVLIGGPPCQGFSQMRRSEERADNTIVKFGGYNQLDQDPRNDLVLRFLELANELRPKCIVIENVPQMRTHQYDGIPGGLTQSVVSLLEEMGYSVAEPQVFNAADYGVPQLRERVFFVASRIGPIGLPETTHADPNTLQNTNTNRQPWVTVQQALADLPAPALGPDDELGGGSIDIYGEATSDYQLQMRSKQAFPYNHLSRTYHERITRIIRHMRPGETWDSASKRMREQYEEILAFLQQPNEDRKSAIERLDTEKQLVKAFYKRYYWSAYTRLAWDKPALTITANVNFLGSGRFTHPEIDRGITMREAARLQSFDDDFQFVTDDCDFLNEECDDNRDTTNISVGMDMIGEAVPPLLAEAFAKKIINALDRPDVCADIQVVGHSIQKCF